MASFLSARFEASIGLFPACRSASSAATVRGRLYISGPNASLSEMCIKLVKRTRPNVRTKGP